MTAPTFDFLGTMAAERVGMPDWHVFRYETLDDGNFLLTGAVVTQRFVRGKRKGQLKWSTRDHRSERKIVITKDQLREYQTAWVARTGNCLTCTGRGEVFVRWSRTEGTTYKTCHKCGGTGKKPE